MDLLKTIKEKSKSLCQVGNKFRNSKILNFTSPDGVYDHKERCDYQACNTFY